MAKDNKESGQAEVQSAPATPAAPAVQELAPLADPQYRITMKGEEFIQIGGRDANEAWALFCDARKSWPSRNLIGVKVERIQ